MKQYVLSMYQPDGVVPPPEVLEPVMARLKVLNEEMQAAGAWVFSGSMRGVESATVVRVRDGEVFTTDGPYTEGKEHIGGFTIIAAPDLDAALEWAGKMVEALTIEFEGRRQSLPLEVRPIEQVRF
jgi:hypothetical protein